MSKALIYLTNINNFKYITVPFIYLDIHQMRASAEEAMERNRWRALIGAAETQLEHKWPRE